MSKVKAVIIDDEPRAIKVIQIQLERHFSNIEVVATSTDAEKAYSVINESKPQLVFIDIEMPNASGFDVLKQFEKRNFEVVFVTAYDQYAIEAFKLNAIGYILKPVDSEDFVKTVTMALIRIGQDQIVNIDELISNLEKKSLVNKMFTISDEGKKVVLNQNEILYCKADGSYCEVKTLEKKYLVSKNLKHICSTMPNWNFLKVSRTYVINPNHIVSFSKKNGAQIVLSDDSIIPVSSRIRKEVFSTLRNEYNIF